METKLLVAQPEEAKCQTSRQDKAILLLCPANKGKLREIFHEAKLNDDELKKMQMQGNKFRLPSIEWR